MTPQKLPETLTKSEVKALLKQPNKNCPTGLRNFNIILTLYRCGLRASELVNLKPEDVDFEKSQIHVWRGKGAKDRKVYLDTDIEGHLRYYMERRPESKWLFSTLKGTKLKTAYLRKTLARYGRKAGISKRVHPHMLRHTFATELLQDGFNIRQVQKALGHSDISTTMIYTHIYDNELHEKFRQRKSFKEGDNSFRGLEGQQLKPAFAGISFN